MPSFCCCGNKGNCPYKCYPQICAEGYNANGGEPTELESVLISVGNICQEFIVDKTYCYKVPLDQAKGICSGCIAIAQYLSDCNCYVFPASSITGICSNCVSSGYLCIESNPPFGCATTAPWAYTFPDNAGTGMYSSWAGNPVVFNGPYEGDIVGTYPTGCSDGYFCSKQRYDLPRSDNDTGQEFCDCFPAAIGYWDCYGDADASDSTVGWNIYPYPDDYTIANQCYTVPENLATGVCAACIARSELISNCIEDNCLECYVFPDNAITGICSKCLDYPSTCTLPLGQGCFGAFPLCSLDSCGSGDPSCIPVPYCPTYLTVTYDDVGDDALPFGSVSVEGYLTIDECPSGICSDASYGFCEVDSSEAPGEGSGSIEGYVLPKLAFDTETSRYIVPDICTGLPYEDQEIYFTVPPGYSVVDGSGPNPSWNATLYTYGCIQQELSLCEENSVEITAEEQGEGGYMDGFQSQSCGTCPGECECDAPGWNDEIPPKWPQGDATINFSIDTGPIRQVTEAGPTNYYFPSLNFAGDFSAELDLQVWSRAPYVQCGNNFSAINYLPQTQEYSVDFPWACSPGSGPGGVAGSLNIPGCLSLGVAGDLTPNGPCNFLDPVQVWCEECDPTAQVVVRWRAGSCDSVNPSSYPCGQPITLCATEGCSMDYCYANGGFFNPGGGPIPTCCTGIGYNWLEFQSPPLAFGYTLYGCKDDSVIDLCEGTISINLYGGGWGGPTPTGISPCASGYGPLVGTLEI